MKGVDLRTFQFDWDLTWHTFFLNANGAIYGRYGTRAGPRNNQMTHISLASFKKSMQRALEVHRAYPANRAALAAKRGPEPEYRVPEEAPALKKFAGPTTVATCIHCHTAGENLLKARKAQNKLSVSDVWAYPLPDNIGLRMDQDDGLRVRSVTPDSPAASAGFAPGDELQSLNGQPLVSQADIQWVLHHAPLDAELSFALKRGALSLDKTVRLAGNWKQRDKSWSDTAWGLRPGVQFELMPQSARKQAGLADGQMGLRVRYAFREAARAGLRTGDIVTAVDGQTNFKTEEHFLACIHLHESKPESVKLKVLRRGEPLELQLPIERSSGE